jgi:aspartate/methionine/tyrosine aminotransferase
VVFFNNASFPSGWVASDEEWEAVGSICRERDVWLLYWGGFEGVLFDGRPVRHPAAHPGMRDRTVTVGAPSLEQRMIAWRVGWVVAPGELVDDVSRVQIYNGLVPSGFAQIGTRAALGVPDEDRHPLLSRRLSNQRRHLPKRLKGQLVRACHPAGENQLARAHEALSSSPLLRRRRNL